MTEDSSGEAITEVRDQHRLSWTERLGEKIREEGGQTSSQKGRDRKDMELGGSREKLGLRTRKDGSILITQFFLSFPSAHDPPPFSGPVPSGTCVKGRGLRLPITHRPLR